MAAANANRIEYSMTSQADMRALARLLVWLQDEGAMFCIERDGDSIVLIIPN